METREDFYHEAKAFLFWVLLLGRCVGKTLLKVLELLDFFFGQKAFVSRLQMQCSSTFSNSIRCIDSQSNSLKEQSSKWEATVVSASIF